MSLDPAEPGIATARYGSLVVATGLNPPRLELADYKKHLTSRVHRATILRFASEIVIAIDPTSRYATMVGWRPRANDAIPCSRFVAAHRLSLESDRHPAR